MKCPWRTIETQMSTEEYGSNITVQESKISFDDCYREECVFWDSWKNHCRRTDELIVED